MGGTPMPRGAVVLPPVRWQNNQDPLPARFENPGCTLRLSQHYLFFLGSSWVAVQVDKDSGVQIAVPFLLFGQFKHAG